MKEIKIDGKNYGQRVDKYLLRFFPQMPKSFLYKMFRKKNICLNKKKIEGSEILQENDLIQIFFAEETFAGFRESKRVQTERSFEILYEDEDVLVVSKPDDLLSQPNGRDRNLVDELSTYLPNERIGIVSRLDRNTTGAVIVGKNVQSLQLLNKTEITKTYHAILSGNLNRPFLLEDKLRKDEQGNKAVISKTVGKQIVTHVLPINVSNGFTLAKVIIKQGKTHQIRAHLAGAGFPIVGDPKYGKAEINRRFQRKYGLTGQLLHCYEVAWDDKKVVAPYFEMWKKVSAELFGKV
ncbi:RluA family pseudouridine synthase [Clostridiales bacterium COT073_COT-073]|nr:RluA family pseudouridine synthase [Clostridiales bacterium COT073_COT-073]